MEPCCKAYTKLTKASPRQSHQFCPHCGKALDYPCYLCKKPVRLQDAEVLLSLEGEHFAHTACIDKAIALNKKEKCRAKAGG